MSTSPENQLCKNRSQLLQEYVSKFPEIPEQDLQRIVEKYSSDPKTCQKMLEEESQKQLYPSSPTPDPPSPVHPLMGAQNRTFGTPPTDLPRSNSTGSAESSHSSGRSTPVNAIPTPWVVPKYPSPTTAGQGATPALYPTAGLPPGTLFINGNYYQPVTSAGISPYNFPSRPLIATGQVSPSDDNVTLGNPTVPQTTRQTSPNASYPIYSTNGHFPANTRSITPLPTASPLPTSTNAPGVPILTRYFTPPNRPQNYAYYQEGENPGYPGIIDPSYQTPPANASFPPGTVLMPAIVTPNLSTSAGSNLTGSTNQLSHGSVIPIFDERRTANKSPNQAISSSKSNSPHSDVMLRTNAGQNMEPLFVSTGFGYSANYVKSPETRRKLNRSSLERLPAMGSFGISNRQRIANDDYLQACIFHQRNRYEKLRKECIVEKERLEIVIKEISERDEALYDMRYIVEPNPTDEQVQKLKEENDKMNREIDEISKNIDRLENGQAFRPPADPRIHDTQRLPGGAKHKDTFDRSNSVPCLHGDPGRGQPPPLSRPLSEHDMNHMIQLDRDRVQYQVKPPSQSPFKDWNFINPSLPDPPTDETQWSCSRCTFLNHDSLTVCEMCGSSRRL